MAIPFKAFGDQPPRAGTTWRFNLCRNRFTEPDAPPFSAWSVTMGGYKNPARFGIATFNSAEDRGQLLWSCDFESGAYAGEEGRSPLIGGDGWYESVSYANLGWDKSWHVAKSEASRVATCDVNNTNTSTIVPMHGARISPGVASVEVDYRRSSMVGNAPQLLVTDADGNYLAYFSVWTTSGELVSLELPQGRQNFTNEHHGLGAFAEPGKWFGIRLAIDTTKKQVTCFVRSGRGGNWIQLNKQPLPYYAPEASGDQWFLGFGTRKHDQADNNIVEMDNIRVTQISPAR